MKERKEEKKKKKRKSKGMDHYVIVTLSMEAMMILFGKYGLLDL